MDSDQTTGISTPEQALREAEKEDGPFAKKSKIIGGNIAPPKLGGGRLGKATDPRAGKQKG